MTDKKIHAIRPDVYTTTPDKGFYSLGGSASGMFHGTGHFYKTAGGSSLSTNRLDAHDTNSFDSRYDDDISWTAASGNPCSEDGFKINYTSNTNDPGYLVGVIATGSRNNLHSWGTMPIPATDQSNCMQNICGCTFVSDSTETENSNSAKIYVHKMGFIYRTPNGNPKVFTLYRSLPGITHFNHSHIRSRVYQGGQLHYNRDISGYTFHGIVVEYWSDKTKGTGRRQYVHRIRNLKFMVRGENESTPSTDLNYGYNRKVVIQHGTNIHTGDRKIYTTNVIGS